MTFTVTVPAPDRTLISLAEAKAALGITNTASDATLATLIAQISDLIARECKVPEDGASPPTLRRETIVETFRQDKRVSPLILARRFVGSITSVVEDGVTLAATDYETDKAAGLVSRLDASGNIICWPMAKIVATYTAGFETIPEPLKLAAITILREQRSAASRDPMLRGETVEGLGRFDYWVNAAPGSGSSVSAVSGVAAAMLDGYRYFQV